MNVKATKETKKYTEARKRIQGGTNQACQEYSTQEVESARDLWVSAGCLPQTKGETLCDTMDEEERKETRRTPTSLNTEGL
ncbi:hypothetical protein AgCh_029308 [Apium graveolens]